MRVAVITPYCDEPDAVLRAAHDSVLAQTHPATHILVADGPGREAINDWEGAQHIVLGRAHGDGGCTPRAAGAIAAFAAGFDAVAFLDADNRYTFEHIEIVVATAARTGAGLVLSDRQIVLADGTSCPFEDRDVVERHHADTSCQFITSRAAFLAAVWATIGPLLWPLCDRLVLATARRRQVPMVWTGRATVIYVSRWGLHYKAMGKPLPPDEHRLDWGAIRSRLRQANPVSPNWLSPKDINAVLNSDHGHVDPDADRFWDRLVRIR